MVPAPCSKIQQLRASQPADQAGDRRVDAGIREPGAPPPAPEHPQADHGTHSDENAKAGDLNADAEETGYISFPNGRTGRLVVWSGLG